MTESDLDRVREDLAIMRQATGFRPPFGIEQVYVSLALSIAGIAVAALTAWTNVSTRPVCARLGCTLGVYRPGPRPRADGVCGHDRGGPSPKGPRSAPVAGIAPVLARRGRRSASVPRLHRLVPEKQHLARGRDNGDTIPCRTVLADECGDRPE